jgi:phage-related tail protein
MIHEPTPTPEFALAVEQELEAYQQRIEQLEASLRLAVRERGKAEQEARDAGGQLGDSEHAAMMARREAQALKEEVR